MQHMIIFFFWKFTLLLYTSPFGFELYSVLCLYISTSHFVEKRCFEFFFKEECGGGKSKNGRQKMAEENEDG